MRSVSGKQLTAEAKVIWNRRWLRKTVAASLRVQDQRVAEIESSFVPTELIDDAKCRRTTVTFIDGARWSIVTGAPGEPPELKKRLGVADGKRHPVSARIAEVREERGGRVLAAATWPDQKLQKQMLLESMAQHGPSVLERVVGSALRPVLEAPQVTVADTTLWLLPFAIPGRVGYGKRLGDVLMLLRGSGSFKLIPKGSVPMEAALLCWHIHAGDVEFVPQAGGGG